MSLTKILRYILIGGTFIVPFIPLVVATIFFFPYITPKALVFRVLTEILAAVWLILVLVNRNYRPRRSLILYAVLALITVLSLATIFGVSPYRSFWSNFERMDGLISYLHLLVYFLIISSVLRTEKQWQVFFHASLGVSIVVAAYAILQLVGLFTITQGGTRVEATLGNAGYLAVYLLIHIFLAVWLWYEGRQRKWLGLVYGPVILLELVVLYYTATRGAILGLIGGTLLTSLLIAVRGKENPTARRLSLAVVVTVILLVVGFLIIKDTTFVKSNPTLSRLSSISLKETTVESRLVIWQMALRGFAERPILGWGPENFLVVFNKYYEPKLFRQEQWFDRSHNIFVDWLVHAGILGLLAYLFLFAAALYYLWRHGRETVMKSIFTGLLAAYSIHNFFVFDNLVSLWLFFSLLAYFHHLKINQPSADEPLPAPRLVPWQAAIGLAGTIVAVASIYWFNLKPAAVSQKIVSALGAAAAENRLEFFQKIFAANTFGSREAAEQLIFSTYRIIDAPAVSPVLKQTYVDTAIQETEKLINHFPDDTRLRLFIGLLFNRLEQPQKSIPYLEETKKLSPRKQVILMELAQAYLMAGNKEKALALAREAFLSSEDYQEAKIVYSVILIVTGRTDEAKALWPDGLPPDSRIINSYVKVNRYQEVLALWQKKVKEEPGNVQYHFSLAAAYLTTGDRSQAIAELREAARIDSRVKPQADSLIAEIRAGRNPLSD